MRVLISGANGFVGQNLTTHLNELNGVEVIKYTRSNSLDELPSLLAGVDCVVHLAGVNRPESNDEFAKGNSDFTKSLLSVLSQQDRKIPIIYSSSIQAERDNPYGISKRLAEDAVVSYGEENDVAVKIYRLANVFGKWCRPNYNSMVATFCYNICNALPIQINDESAEVSLVYVDDVCKEFIKVAKELASNSEQRTEIFGEVVPVYRETVGEVAKLLYEFKKSRDTLISARVGDGFIRKLYSTYVSYLSTDDFSYKVPKYGDERGVFVEMLKTKDSGQFSFFTAHPGITRGGHYHHTKNEKFLVIKGRARFCFRHMITNEFYELVTDGDTPEVVETAPGWSHDITNIGDEEMVVMLWANEIFDRENPDTFAAPVKLTD